MIKIEIIIMRPTYSLSARKL